MEEQILNELELLKKSVEDLDTEFRKKGERDEWMKTKFDEMHSRLLSYQDGIVEKRIDPLLKSVILLSDSIRKDVSSVEDEHIKTYLNNLIDQIDAILFEYDIEVYSGPDYFDPKLQTASKVIKTDEPENYKRVASVVTVGYKRNDKVFRTERVIIYKYEERGIDNE